VGQYGGWSALTHILFHFSNNSLVSPFFDIRSHSTSRALVQRDRREVSSDAYPSSYNQGQAYGITVAPNPSRKLEIPGPSIQDMGVSESSRLEVRWIVPGSAPPLTAKWFARFPSTTEEREDLYLVMPRLPNLAVKIRGGQALDVKEFRGTRGVLELTGFGQGRLESWRKWSFPFGETGPSRENPLAGAE